MSCYSRVRPEEWEFANNAYGRPGIVNEEASGLEFNLSHSNGLIMLAITRGSRLGVDCETLTRPDCVALADRFFANAEVAALHALPPPARERRFLELWTLKESYIKARGMGLSIPLNEFSFALPELHIELSVDTQRDEAGRRWKFLQFLATPDHIAAVCVEYRGWQFPSMDAYRVVPLVTMNSVRIDPLRVSRRSDAPSADLFACSSDNQS